MENAPLVSISCITYNHSEFIKECLDGFLMQHCNFEYEILIHDDASTDGTQEIIREYQQKFPHIIFPIFQKENQYSKGVRRMMPRFNFPRAKGRYIALCEGDDYWTDPNKLQKQVDFLEANPDYAICYHKTSILNSVLTESHLNPYHEGKTFTVADLALYNFIETVSVVFRNGLINPFPKWLEESPVGDYPLHMLNARKGKIKFLPDNMAVYRYHPGSSWSSKPRIYQLSKLNVLIDYLIEEFKADNAVVQNLLLQKFKYLDEIITEQFISGKDEGFRSLLESSVKQHPEFIHFWLKNGFGKILEQKNHAERNLKLIRDSNTYKLLKRLNIFK